MRAIQAGASDSGGIGAASSKKVTENNVDAAVRAANAAPAPSPFFFLLGASRQLDGLFAMLLRPRARGLSVHEPLEAIGLLPPALLLLGIAVAVVAREMRDELPPGDLRQIVVERTIVDLHAGPRRRRETALGRRPQH